MEWTLGASGGTSLVKVTLLRGQPRRLGELLRVVVSPVDGICLIATGMLLWRGFAAWKNRAGEKAFVGAKRREQSAWGFQVGYRAPHVFIHLTMYFIIHSF
jgi:hypothetical protein